MRFGKASHETDVPNIYSITCTLEFGKFTCSTFMQLPCTRGIPVCVLRCKLPIYGRKHDDILQLRNHEYMCAQPNACVIEPLPTIKGYMDCTVL